MTQDLTLYAIEETRLAMLDTLDMVYHVYERDETYTDEARFHAEPGPPSYASDNLDDALAHCGPTSRVWDTRFHGGCWLSSPDAVAVSRQIA